MKTAYTATEHNIVKALANADVIFPLSKTDLLRKAGDQVIQIDFEQFTTLREYCTAIAVDYFCNKEVFFCALHGAHLDFSAL